MSDVKSRSILALGIFRLLKLEQKKKQVERARKVKVYLKITKALNSYLFKNQLRIDSNSFFKLLGLIRPHIEGLNADLNEVSVEERLLVTLMYLAGIPMAQLNIDNVESHILVKIVLETCKLIYKCLWEYTKFPKTAGEWEDIVTSFEKKWNFSNCAGALVAKHIAVDEPHTAASTLLNHKNYHSIVLVGVVNADYQFTYFSSGCEGGYENVYVSTKFFEMLVENSLELPADRPLKGTDDPMPYVFLGETDFLIENIMRPYPVNQLTDERKIFNYRFSRAKRVADNAFGILYERFGVLREKLSPDENRSGSIVLACCSLHNFLIVNGKDYLNEESLDMEDVNNLKFKNSSWRLKMGDGMEWRDTHPLHSIRENEEHLSDSKGGIVREKFTNYFNNEGKVPFQDQMVNVVPDL